MKMKIGESFDKLILEIARETFEETCNLEKAIDIIESSYHGCSSEQALQIFKGELITKTDVEQQTVTVSENRGVPDYNLLDKISRKEDRLFEDLKDCLLAVIHKIKVVDITCFNSIPIHINKLEIVPLLNEIKIREDTGEYLIPESIIENFKEQLVERLEMDLGIKELSEFIPRTIGLIDKLLTLYQSCKVYKISFDENKHKALLRIKQELEKEDYNKLDVDILNSGSILNCKIENKYNGGWISPIGSFYGLFGTKDRLIHISISELLRKLQIEDLGANFSDSDMEKSGWVKVFDLRGVYAISDITQPQKEQLEKLAKAMKILNIGFRQIPVSYRKLVNMSLQDFNLFIKTKANF